MRISLLHALLLFAAAGLALAALLSGHPVWRQILFLFTAAALILAALAALAWEGDERRWFAIGFVLVGVLSFWSAGDPGTVRYVPLLDQAAEYFFDRHTSAVSTSVGNGESAYLTESGRVVVRESGGGLRGLREQTAEQRGYPVANLQILRGRENFQQIADFAATLLLAYLGGVAGMLVRRARRAPEEETSGPGSG